MDENELRNQLNRPHVPDDLETKIRTNWCEQRTKQRIAYKPAILAFVAASLFGIFVGTSLLNTGITRNDLINAAIKDIDNDEKQHTGIILPVDSLITQAHIHYPPESMTVKMSKICNLDRNETIHLKIAGEKQGEVHLFIKEGNFDLMPSSQNKTMPWKLIKPRDNLSVLVLYTQDMNPANVDRLIQTMFYA